MNELPRRILNVSATSSPIERIFSKSGILFRQHRTEISTKTQEMTALLEYTQECIFDELIVSKLRYLKKAKANTLETCLQRFICFTDKLSILDLHFCKEWLRLNQKRWTVHLCFSFWLSHENVQIKFSLLRKIIGWIQMKHFLKQALDWKLVRESWYVYGFLFLYFFLQ